MSNGSGGAAAKTRTCPHCRATILQSASVCPICRKSLRWEPHTAKHKPPGFSALHVEGAIKHPESGENWEYMVLVTVKNEKGEEINRHMVDVGALGPGDRRTFDLSVEVYTEPRSKR
jgi:hypothetical protein